MDVNIWRNQYTVFLSRAACRHTLGISVLYAVVQYATQYSFNKIKDRCRRCVMRHAALQPAVTLSHYPAILDGSRFTFHHRPLWILKVNARFFIWTCCNSDGDGETQWGGGSSCCTGMLETKHDASEAEGPSSKAKKKKRVESLGEGGRGEITHPLVSLWIKQSPKNPQGSRCDATPIKRGREAREAGSSPF